MFHTLDACFRPFSLMIRHSHSLVRNLEPVLHKLVHSCPRCYLEKQFKHLDLLLFSLSRQLWPVVAADCNIFKQEQMYFHSQCRVVVSNIEQRIFAFNRPFHFTLKTRFILKAFLFQGASETGVNSATSLLLMHSSPISITFYILSNVPSSMLR